MFEKFTILPKKTEQEQQIERFSKKTTFPIFKQDNRKVILKKEYKTENKIYYNKIDRSTPTYVTNNEVNNITNNESGGFFSIIGSILKFILFTMPVFLFKETSKITISSFNFVSGQYSIYMQNKREYDECNDRFNTQYRWNDDEII